MVVRCILNTRRCIMRLFRSVVLSTGAAAIAIAALVSQASAADPQAGTATKSVKKAPVAKAQVQAPAKAVQPAQANSTAQRRTYRSYSYEPQYNRRSFNRTSRANVVAG